MTISKNMVEIAVKSIVTDLSEYGVDFSAEARYGRQVGARRTLAESSAVFDAAVELRNALQAAEAVNPD